MRIQANETATSGLTGLEKGFPDQEVAPLARDGVGPAQKYEFKSGPQLATWSAPSGADGESGGPANSEGESNWDQAKEALGGAAAAVGKAWRWLSGQFSGPSASADRSGPARVPFAPGKYTEFKGAGGPGGAGNTAALDAYNKMQSSVSAVGDRKEYGCLIFEWQGRTFTTPLVSGKSAKEGSGTAEVSFSDMLKNLPDVDGITIVGLVHSHPYPGAFSSDQDPDKKTADLLGRISSWNAPDGRTYNINFHASFIASPLDSQSFSGPKVDTYYPKRP